MNSFDLELLLVCFAKGLRTFGFGCVSVILAIFLTEHSFSALQVGAIFSATLIEDAIFTTAVSLFATKLGIRRVLVLSGALMVVSGICICLATQPWLIAIAAVCGIFSPAGFEGGPFTAVEQAIIAREVASDKLTRAFSWYNLSGFAGAALGSLLAGVCFAKCLGTNHQIAFHQIFLISIASGIIMTAIYVMLPLNYVARSSQQKRLSVELKVSLGAVLQKKNAGALVFLQGLDSFGGGFVLQSLIAYWFYMRYQVGAEFTGLVFFAANVLAAGSFLAAPLLASRIGLLKTMVFTHLPCSIALCFLPFMPTAQLAAALLLARSLFSSMDIPARQAYTMLLVHPDDRAAVAGLTTASRSIAQGFSPIVSGWVTLNAMAGYPFIIAGLCKTVYDLCLYATFRKIPLETSLEISSHKSNADANGERVSNQPARR